MPHGVGRLICRGCGRPKAQTHSGIGVCEICDTDNTNPDAELFWPADYVAWRPGSPYPGAVD